MTLRPSRFALSLLVVLMGWWVVSAHATVGLAEWEVTPPGPHRVCHADIRPEAPVAR